MASLTFIIGAWSMRFPSTTAMAVGTSRVVRSMREAVTLMVSESTLSAVPGASAQVGQVASESEVAMATARTRRVMAGRCEAVLMCADPWIYAPTN
jgi:hypothetical protein